MSVKPLTRTELLGLPPVTTIPMLGRAFGISYPTALERHRRGEFEEMGIRVLPFGKQWRVVTADILNVLRIGPEPTAAGEQQRQEVA